MNIQKTLSLRRHSCICRQEAPDKCLRQHPTQQNQKNQDVKDPMTPTIIIVDDHHQRLQQWKPNGDKHKYKQHHQNENQSTTNNSMNNIYV